MKIKDFSRFFFYWLVLLLGLGGVVVMTAAAEQSQSASGTLAFHQSLLDLTTGFRLMSVAAHPDDEDGASLAYYRRKFGVKTFMVLATLGEGGQNEIGPELYADLAVIRARETQAAAAVLGAQTFNLRCPDFGYSKSAEETFRYWDHDLALGRLVKVIREVRPHVIITHHDTSTGHGNHQAIGRLLLEAFDVAADPTKFSEQLEAGLEPWQVQRLYLRSFRPADEAVSYDASEMNRVWGKTYLEMAAESLALHKSQGMDTFAFSDRRRAGKIYYKLIREAGTDSASSLSPIGGLFAGMADPQEKIPVFRKAATRRLTTLLKRTSADFTISRDDLAALALKSVSEVRQALKETAESSDQQELIRLESRLSEIATAASGITLRVRVSDRIVVPGQKLTVEADLSNLGGKELGGLDLEPQFPTGFNVDVADDQSRRLASRQKATLRCEVEVPATASLTLPAAEHVSEEDFIRPLARCAVKFELGRVSVRIVRPVEFDVAPPVHIRFPHGGLVALAGRGSQPNAAELRVHFYSDHPTRGELNLRFDGVGRIEATEQLPSALKEDSETSIPVVVAVNGASTHSLNAELTTEDGYVATASIPVRYCDVKVADDLYVGIVSSYDDTIERSLGALGVDTKLLTPVDLGIGDLSRYDTIIVDMRAYMARPDLVANNNRLLEYAASGGNMVVMYQKTFEWNTENGNPAFAPYPIRLGRDRVCEENAPVKILRPEHPLLKFPNNITAEDFDGWVQERGLYFPEFFSNSYTPLIASADTSENILESGYLVANFGRGTYVYTCYVWYRQLKNLHEGALKVLANMVSLPRFSFSEKN